MLPQSDTEIAHRVNAAYDKGVIAGQSKLRREVAMPLLAADPVLVEPAQREALEALVRAHSTSQQLAVRARMILQAADDVGVRESARELGVWPKTVRYWRGRWRRAPPAQCVPERLADAPRSGALRHTPPSRFAR